LSRQPAGLMVGDSVVGARVVVTVLRNGRRRDVVLWDGPVSGAEEGSTVELLPNFGDHRDNPGERQQASRRMVLKLEGPAR